MIHFSNAADGKQNTLANANVRLALFDFRVGTYLRVSMHGKTEKSIDSVGSTL